MAVRKFPDIGKIAPWATVGAEAVVLEYHGHGHYSAWKTTITRVTPRQVITADGNRWWIHHAMKLVGQISTRIAGIHANPMRLVAPDNPHSIRCLGTSGPD